MKIIRQVHIGEKLISKICEESSIDISRDYVIVVPDKNEQINAAVIKGINYLIRQKSNEFGSEKDTKFLIVTSVNNDIKNLNSFYSMKCKIINVSDEKIKEILRYYAFRKRSSNLIIASLDKPNGRQCWGLVNAKKTSVEEIIIVAVLNVKYENYRQWSCEGMNIQNEERQVIKE